MGKWQVNRRQKSIGRGLLRTTPFIAAGVLSLVLFYSQTNQTFDWEWDGMIVLVFLFLCWTVFFTVSQRLPYSKKNIIDDLLISSLYHLGPKEHRINIMELRTSVHNAFESFFEITFGHGYNDPSKYKGKITMDIPGASQAYKDRIVVYLPQARLRSDLDPEVKHLWSAPIKNRRGDSVAVMNIDNIEDDTLPQETIDHTSTAIEQVAVIISYYWEIPE